MPVTKRVLSEVTAQRQVNCMRAVLTGIYTPIILTPSGTYPAEVIAVLAVPVASTNSFSMSFSFNSVGAPGGAVLASQNGGFYTGTIAGGSYATATLSGDTAKRVIAAGSVCYLSSTNHTSSMAVEIFYRTQVY